MVGERNIDYIILIFRYDWYQNEKSVTIVIYSKYKDVTEADVIVRVNDKKNTLVWVAMGDKTLQLCLGK